jgi:PhnB protein
MLSYEDVGAAAEWLCEAFGFTEVNRFEGGGRVTHVNLAAGDGLVMIGWPGPDYRSPIRHRETCDDARRWLESPFVVDGVYVQVEGIDEHAARARSAGAAILSDVEENVPAGQRQYRAADLEGHRWMFAEPLETT